MQPSQVKFRPSWHDVRFDMARAIATRSLCVRDQVGAIIVDVDNKVIGEGHNGPPKGFWHGNTACDQWCHRAKLGPDIEVRKMARDYSDCPALHAESNALMMSDRSLRSGGTIYVTSHVCSVCAKLIANSGLHCVRVDASTANDHRRSVESYEFLTKCGLEVYVSES